MRYFNIFVAALTMISSLSLGAQTDKTESFYGETFKMSQERESVPEIHNALKTKKQVNTQLTGTIKEVCQVKGCWMKVELENSEEVFVRFKDYGFFVPTDSENNKVVLNGAVFHETVSVEDQKHYAKDRGDSPEKIAKITTPIKQLRFEADGVLIYNQN